MPPSSHSFQRPSGRYSMPSSSCFPTLMRPSSKKNTLLLHFNAVVVFGDDGCVGAVSVRPLSVGSVPGGHRHTAIVVGGDGVTGAVDVAAIVFVEPVAASGNDH